MRSSVLLIEDEVDIREPIAEVLRQEGFAVLEAADGAQGLELLRDSSPPPAAILLDLMLPVMDGTSFRQRQLAVRAWAHIPVIVMTGLSPSDVLASFGPVSTLKKPFLPDALLAALRAVAAPPAYGDPPLAGTPAGR